MGIPSYYKKIIENYPEITHKKCYNLNIKIDYLFLDLNCAIHPCYAEQMFTKCMYLFLKNKCKCISLTNVKKLVYIAIDGPAPRTKWSNKDVIT